MSHTAIHAAVRNDVRADDGFERAAGFSFDPGSDLASATRQFYQAAGNTAAEWIHWLMPLDEQVILNKDGSMLAVFEITGHDVDSTSNAQFNQVRRQILYALQQIQERGATVWWQVRRRRTTDYPRVPMPDPVSQRLDDDLYQAFLDNPQFINRHHVIVSLVPEAGAMRLLQALRRADEEKSGVLGMAKALWGGVFGSFQGEGVFPYANESQIAEALQQFRKYLDQFSAAMSSVHLHALKGPALGGFLEIASSPTSDMDTQVELPLGGYLDTSTCACEIDNNFRDVLRFSRNGRDVWASTYSLDVSRRKELQLDTLDPLMSAPFEFTLSQVFKMQPQSKAEKAIHSFYNYHRARRLPMRSYIFAAFNGGDMSNAPVNPERDAAAAEAQDLKHKIGVGAQGAGLWHGTVMVQASSPAQLMAHGRKCEELLQQARIRPVLERLHKFSSFCATVPGSQSQVALWRQITTDNFVDLCPVRTLASGSRMNDHLSEQLQQPCHAMVVLPTGHRSPYFFTGFVGDLGHGMTIGPSGTGKTTFINLCWTKFRQYRSARVIVFDKDHSVRPSVLLQGGRYLDLNPESQTTAQARAESAVMRRARMGPLRSLLAHEHHGKHLPAALEFVLLLASQHGYAPSAQDRVALEKVLIAVAAQAQAKPANLRLQTVVALLPATSDLARELTPWIEGHVFGAYFDNAEDDFDVQGLVAVENGAILEHDKLAAPYMYYAFYRISSQLRQLEADGVVVPTFIYVPEMWFFLKNTTFQEKFFEFLVTLRKLNAVVWLDTQSPDRLVESKIYSALRDNIATLVLTPNRKALTGSLSTLYRDEFLLSQEELQAIADGSPKEDYWIKQGAFSRRVKLRLPRSVMGVLRSDKRAQSLLEKHIADPSSDPGKTWQQRYLQEINHE